MDLEIFKIFKNDSRETFGWLSVVNFQDFKKQEIIMSLKKKKMEKFA